MRFKLKLLAGAVAAAALLASPIASAKTFKWAFQGNLQSLDPHSLFETFSLGFWGNIYESLVTYDDNMKVVPSLATSWEVKDPTHWVFHLRKGVKFHNGNDFNADDVIFSYTKRALTEGSDLKVPARKMKSIKKIDDYTIEVETDGPNPILTRDLIFLYILDKEWSEEHKTTMATSPKGGDEGNYANLHANGTGPFMVESHSAGVKTVLKRNDHWWGKMKSNVTDAVFTPISQDATRVAALISGELDLAYPVPLQDWKRLENAPGVKPLHGPEARTIFLGMDQTRDELLYSSVKGKNPFKDVRVRKAFAHAIDINAIKDKVMRGASTPSALMIAPQINGFVKELNTWWKYDPKMSKKLLADAGYPDGFKVTMDCPNDRYVNDEKICQAVAAMLARVGVKVDVLAQTKSKYFGKVLSQNNYDTSFYLLGWTPGTFDAYQAIEPLIMCRTKPGGHGLFNLGGYCNDRIDELGPKIQSETDQAKRQEMIAEVFRIHKEEVGHIPLHQQPLSWGVSDKVSVVQRPDNVLDLRYVVVK
jgi:peptide/nickel transport system substrate-binding protein